DRDLHSANLEIERNLEFTLARTGVPKHQDGQAVHRETPNHTERVEVRQESDIAMADQNRKNLQCNNDVDDAIARAELRVGLAEPFAQHAILGNAVEHAVGPNNRGINCARENENAYYHHK